MDLGRLIDAAKGLLEGNGLEGLKDQATEFTDQAGEFTDIAQGEGGIADKAEAAVESIQTPGESAP
jgi:hypothetical protein